MNPRTLPPPATLDKWDVAFIRHFKSAGPISMNTLMTIWAERVGMEVDPISFRAYVAGYLANLIDRLNLTPNLSKIITDMNPINSWRYGIDNSANHNERAILVMGAWLCHTEVKYLPGYAEAVEFPYPLPLDGPVS